MKRPVLKQFEPDRNPEVQSVRANIRARQMFAGKKLQYERYVPARDNPDTSRYRPGIRPITLTGKHGHPENP